VRALYVNHTSRISGGELSLISLLEALPPHVEAIVACPEGPLAERLRSAAVEVVPIGGTDGSLRLHPTRTPRAVAEMALASIEVRRVARAAGADLVHANSIRAGIVATGLPAARTPPTIVHVRDCLPPGTISAISLKAIGRADALIANSAHTRSTLGSAASTAHVVHNAVDCARFDRVELSRAASRARLGLDERCRTLAVVAQITPWKAQDDAIRVLRELLSSHPDLQLLLVGSAKFDSAATRYDNDAYLRSLHRLVAELRLAGSIRFLGERDDVPEVLRAVDLLLVPSWQEPFGRTVIEAMAAGVPVVATDVGGPPEILADRACGLLLPPRQPPIWAAAIDDLLQDPAKLAAMGERGRAEARRHFGVQRHVAATLAIYESVLAAAPTA
jgi:L-malate glycosyltransferase